MSDVREMIVVKCGSSSVANEFGVQHEWLAGYAEQLAELHKFYDLAIVTSGAIAVGNAIWRRKQRAGIPDNQTLATIGAPHVSVAWQNVLDDHGIAAGQILVTHREIDEPEERSMLEKVIANNRKVRAVPIFNENDALSNQEIAELSYGGDNDGLAGHIARVVRARYLLLLTGVDGLFDKGKLIRIVNTEQDEARAKLVAGMPNNTGRGGMRTKVEAAVLARRHGVEVHIANAAARMADVLIGEAGTTFPALQTLHGSTNAVELELSKGKTI